MYHHSPDHTGPGATVSRGCCVWDHSSRRDFTAYSDPNGFLMARTLSEPDGFQKVRWVLWLPVYENLCAKPSWLPCNHIALPEEHDRQLMSPITLEIRDKRSMYPYMVAWSSCFVRGIRESLPVNTIP